MVPTIQDHKEVIIEKASNTIQNH